MDALARTLDDPESVRLWVAEKDDPRWDDPEDHGDPKIERFGRTLAQLGPDVAVAATIACAETIAIVWQVDVGTRTIENAIAAARSKRRIDAALAGLAADESRASYAHTRDVWQAARCALFAARDPSIVGRDLELAALFAYRVIGWSAGAVTGGQRAVTEQLARFAADGTDSADRHRQTLRCALRAALLV